MDYLHAPAGEELDSLVAKLVMKLEICRCGFSMPYDDPQCPNCKKHRKPPAYSTQAAAAWELVEAMRQRGVMFTITAARGGFDVEEQPFTAVSAATMPLAVCRAALRSVGIA